MCKLEQSHMVTSVSVKKGEVLFFFYSSKLWIQCCDENSSLDSQSCFSGTETSSLMVVEKAGGQGWTYLCRCAKLQSAQRSADYFLCRPCELQSLPVSCWTCSKPHSDMVDQHRLNSGLVEGQQPLLMTISERCEVMLSAGFEMYVVIYWNFNQLPE